MSAVSAAICLVNGAEVSELSVLDRGLTYGDGVFETIGVRRGELTLGDYHFARLERDALRLRIPLNLAEARTQAHKLASRIGDGVIKIILTRGAGDRGYALPSNCSPTLIVQSLPFHLYPSDRSEKGIALFPCTTQLAFQPLLAGIKHLNRLEQVLARSEWDDPQYAEGLVCDAQGNPVECTMSNIFMMSEGCWVTPDLSRCGVRGVMRDYLIDCLGRSGQEVIQREVALSELLKAEEIFCCNSIFGVWPVVGLMNQQWAVGPHTRGVQAMAQQVLM